MFDWNDLKAFLAVARSGSTLGAAKALGVNQTTVARRIEALETALALKLFERGQTGSRLTESGRDLVAEAEKVEVAAIGFHSRATSHQRGLAGNIRITATEIIANAAVTPALGEFRRLYPDVQVDLILTDRALDIEKGEADVAIRSAHALPASDLIARKLVEYDFALYCSREYAQRRGIPATPADLKDHDLIHADSAGGALPGIAWMFNHAGGKAPASRSNSMTNLVHAVKAGLGIAPLACLTGDVSRQLVRCSEPIEELRGTSWIVTRRDLKDTPRVRALIDFLVPYVQQQFRSLEARGQMLRDQAASELDESPIRETSA
jgi:DNA-binding transcriptional LysR family regulator